MIDIEASLKEYERQSKTYEALRDVTVPLLRRLLKKAGIEPHSITPRIKSRKSLREKMTRDGKSYSSLSDIKDIVGIRIITYFEDELETVGHVIESSFDVDLANSYDRRSKLNTDQFGYRSIHYVCNYSAQRVQMDEYAEFAGHVIEIQIRSILQHAWAEIEHDYYKTKGKKPESIERRNSRLAGLLELADDEFVAIRKEMETYKRNVGLRIEADENLDNVKLDSISLKTFVEQDPLLRATDERFSTVPGVVFNADAKLNPEPTLRALSSVSVETLEELRSALQRNAKYLKEFYREWRDALISQGQPPAPSFHPGISAYHLALFLAALKGPEALQKTFESVFNSGPLQSQVGVSVQKLPTFAKHAIEIVDAAAEEPPSQ
jgi:ppGpp synthetase/RelA/SpoT-type nucleotidyltranferase